MAATDRVRAIFSVRLDLKTGHLSDLKLAAQIERPTWLMLDPKRPVLYAVSETGNDGKAQGGVYSFAVDRRSGRLKLINRVASGGGGATHLTYDTRLNTVFVGNFGGGQVGAFPVKPNGALSPLSSMQTDYGHGPHPRQTMAHAHGVTVDPSGHFLLSADMGADRIFVYRFDAATKTLTPAPKPFEQMPAGSGPRHLVFSPDGRFAFLDTELSAQIVSFRWDAQAGRLTQIQSQAIDKPAFKGEKSAAEVAVSRDGRFVYVSNRGENSLQVYAVDQKSGRLSAVAGHSRRRRHSLEFRHRSQRPMDDRRQRADKLHCRLQDRSRDRQAQRHRPDPVRFQARGHRLLSALICDAGGCVT